MSIAAKTTNPFGRRLSPLLLCLLATVLFMFFTGASSTTSLRAAEEDQQRIRTYTDGTKEYVLSTEPLDQEAATITTDIELGTTLETANTDSTILAGFGAAQETTPDDLAVVWTERKRGWFPVWEVGLQTSLDVLPEALLEKRPDQGQIFLTLDTLTPKPGHVYYQTTLSYIPAHGYLSVQVVDKNSGRRLLARALRLKPYKGPLFAGAGVVASRETASEVFVKDISVHPGFIPVGTYWTILQPTSSDSWVPVGSVKRNQEAVVELMTGLDSTLPGAFRLVADTAAGPIVIGEAAEVSDKTLMLLDVSGLPPGELGLTLQYLVEGKARYCDRRTVAVGNLEVRLGQLSVDDEKKAIQGRFVLQSDGPLPAVGFTADIRVNRQLLTRGQRIEDTFAIDRQLDVLSKPQYIPFEIPISGQLEKVELLFGPTLQVEKGVRYVLDIPKQETLYCGKTKTEEERLMLAFAMVQKQFLDEFVLSESAGSYNLPADDGSWPDINYEHRDVANWQVAEHLERVKSMALDFRRPASPRFQDKHLNKSIITALEYWIKNDFQNPNWWWNEIWLPWQLGDILLSIADDIPKDLKEQARSLVRRGIDRYMSKGAAASTGTNLVWNERNRIRLGLLQEDPLLVADAFSTIAGEVRVVGLGREGIQQDYSFHQHGPQLYSGGYGGAFTVDVSRLAYVARGTPFFPEGNLKVLVDFILEGQQWMVRNQTFDFSATGREISRGYHKSGNTRFLLTACEKLLQIPQVPREDELRSLAARLKGSGPSLKGNRHFWR